MNDFENKFAIGRDSFAIVSDRASICLNSKNRIRMGQFDGEGFSILPFPSGGEINECKGYLAKGEQSVGYISSGLCMPKACFFDMDATLVREETLVELAKILGFGAEFEEITKRAMEGDISFEESLKDRLSFVKGKNPKELPQLTHTLRTGVLLFCNLLSSLKIPFYVISGGFLNHVESVTREIMATGRVCNEFEIDAMGKLTGSWNGALIDAKGKRVAVEQICRSLGISTSETWIFGDGANDIDMIKLTPFGFGVSPKQRLRSFLAVAGFEEDSIDSSDIKDSPTFQIAFWLLSKMCS